MATMRNLLAGTDGAVAIEYVLIASLIAVAIIASFTAFSGAFESTYLYLASKLAAL